MPGIHLGVAVQCGDVNDLSADGQRVVDGDGVAGLSEDGDVEVADNVDDHAGWHCGRQRGHAGVPGKDVELKHRYTR